MNVTYVNAFRPTPGIESLINTRTLKKRCALAARTEVKQTQEL